MCYFFCLSIGALYKGCSINKSSIVKSLIFLFLIFITIRAHCYVVGK